MTNANATTKQAIAINALTELGYEANESMTDAALLELLETAERSICIEGQSILYKQANLEYQQRLNREAIEQAKANAIEAAASDTAIQRRAKATGQLTACIRDVYSLTILLITACIIVVKAYVRAAVKRLNDWMNEHMPATVSAVSEAYKGIKAMGVTGIMDMVFCLS